MLYPHAKFGGDLPPHGCERGKNRCFSFVCLLPAGQPPVLKLLGCPILRFFALQGRHDSRINVTFATAPNCTLLGKYLGISGPKNTKICQQISKVANFFAPQGRIPRLILVKFMCYMRLTRLRNMLKFGAIWFINDKCVGTKLRWVISPPQFLEPPNSEITGRTQKVEARPKWYGHALSTRQF